MDGAFYRAERRFFENEDVRRGRIRRGTVAWRAIGFALACAATVQAPEARADYFFAPVSQPPPTSAPAQAQATQYLTLYARMSVFALYCDSRNERGMNTQASQLGRRTRPSYQQAERVLGGAAATETRFERMRNDESARMAVADVDAVCWSEDSVFWRLAPLSNEAFAAQASRLPLR